MMSNTGQQKRTLIDAGRHLWGLGGMRAYYRGLTVCPHFPEFKGDPLSSIAYRQIGLIGVFPFVQLFSIVVSFVF